MTKTQAKWTTNVLQEMTYDLVTVRPETPLDEVARLFCEHHITGVPVVNVEGRAIGVVSQTDLIGRLAERGACEGVVDDVMTALAVALPENATMARAAAVMATERLHRLPVLTSDGRLCGILTSMDVVRWVAKTEGLLAQQGATNGSRG